MARRRGYSGIPDIYDRWGLITPIKIRPNQNSTGQLQSRRGAAARRCSSTAAAATAAAAALLSGPHALKAFLATGQMFSGLKMFLYSRCGAAAATLGV